MSFIQDLGLLLGLVLILVGTAFAVSKIGLPGTGVFDNPIDEIRSTPNPDKNVETWDVSTQINIGSTTAGDVSVDQFSYQTNPSCDFCLSVARGRQFAVLGADNVKADVRVVNQDTGKVYVQTTKFLGELKPAQDKTVNVDWDNAKTGTYLVRYIVTFDPSIGDITNPDNTVRKRFTIQVPKGGVTG